MNILFRCTEGYSWQINPSDESSLATRGSARIANRWNPVESAGRGRWKNDWMPGVPFRKRWWWGGGGVLECSSESQNDRNRVIFEGWTPRADWFEKVTNWMKGNFDSVGKWKWWNRFSGKTQPDPVLNEPSPKLRQNESRTSKQTTPSLVDAGLQPQYSNSRNPGWSNHCSMYCVSLFTVLNNRNTQLVYHRLSNYMKKELKTTVQVLRVSISNMSYKTRSKTKLYCVLFYVLSGTM